MWNSLQQYTWLTRFSRTRCDICSDSSHFCCSVFLSSGSLSAYFPIFTAFFTNVLELSHFSTVNLKVVGGKIFMKLIFVVKCSYRCQETTISNPPESLGGGPPFLRA